MSTLRYCIRCLSTFQDDPASCPNLACRQARPGAGWAEVLAAGQLLDRHYQVVQALAIGGAGITYKAREVDGAGAPQPPDLAVKVLYANRASGPFLRRLANEAQILRELQHDNIVDCRGFVHRAGSEPYLVTLFEQGGSLADHVRRVGPVSPRVAAGVVRQILLALDQAHQHGVVHRDLKPDNVLLREAVPVDVVPRIRVADFGIAKVSTGFGRVTQLGAFVGTPEYAAPEQFLGQRPTAATDVFAVGGLLFYLLTGEAPVKFTRREDPETSLEELLAAVPPRLPASVRPAGDRERLQQVLDHGMCPKAQDRWTVQQTLQALAEVVPPRPLVPYDTLELTQNGKPRPERAARGAPAESASSPEPPALTFTADWTEEEPKPAAELPRTEWVRQERRSDTPAPAPLRPLPERPRTPSPNETIEPPDDWSEELSEEVLRPTQLQPTPQRPTPAPVAPRRPARTARAAGGCLGAIAGLLGLGVAGAGLLTLAGGGLAVIVLLVAAWLFGWFGVIPAEVVLQTRVIDGWANALDEAPALLGSADPSWRAARLAVQEALDARAAELAAACGRSGPVLGTVLLDADGVVRAARVDAPAGACLADALVGVQATGVGEPVAARVGLALPR